VINLIRKGANKIGIDGAIAFTILSRIIQASGGVITLLVVAKCLTKVEQGYYYTFGSILAVQIFFELGLSNIITQFVAHENVHLIWNNRTHFTGSVESGSRLSSLLRFTVKWFGLIAIFLFFALLLVGYIFFNKFGKENINVSWQVPWIILSVTTSLSLMVSPILAFFEGLGRVKEVAKVRLIQQVVQLSLVLLLFTLGFKLFSVPIAAIVTFAIVPIWIFFGSKIKLLKFVWSRLDRWVVNYHLEIFPFQWKIALSWISGYFIFQLFNPVLFATEGAVVAGQMGMTLTVLNSIFSLAFSWISTKIPAFSNLIAQKEYGKLNKLFNKTLIQSSILNAFGLILFFALIFILRYFDIKICGKNFADRFLPFLPMLFMMIPILLNHIVAAWATYLRCHKKEPLLKQSIVIGILCSISTISLGNFFGVVGMTSGYLTLTLVSFIWTYFIFRNKKEEWHNEE
jgi:O-antigen/teichoic acid export membrane protein